MNHIWFRDMAGSFGFVKNANGETKTVYVLERDFDQYLHKPSMEAKKWNDGEWTDVPRNEALKLYGL